MTDDKKKPPRKRAPRKRSNAKEPHTHSPDAAKRNQEPTADAASPLQDARAQSAPGQPSGTRTLAAIPIHVRWRDLDAFNHVNNSSYLTFLEEARLQWLRNVPGEWFSEHAMPVMAAVELHYRKPITWPSEVDVLMTCERMGNASITIGNRIVARDDADCVYADGSVVMVWIDPATGASVPLPKAIRQACA